MPIVSTLAKTAHHWVTALPVFSIILAYASYKILRILIYEPLTSPLESLPGPPKPRKLFSSSHLVAILDAVNSKRNSEILTQRYGKNIRIQGFNYWDQRLLTFDARAINYILVQANDIYIKPWQTRRLLSRLLGDGIVFAEGEDHKRQRRIINPAFSTAGVRKLNPILRSKAEELCNRWLGLSSSPPRSDGYTTIDINHWISRATFDAFMLAAFSSSLGVIQNDNHPLYLAYKQLFDASFNGPDTVLGLLSIYVPWLIYLPTSSNRKIRASSGIILETGKELIEERRQASVEGTMDERTDLLSLLIKSNLDEASPKRRLTDSELLAQVHVFLMLGSDSSTLSITWILYELSRNAAWQSRLREELFKARQSSPPQDVSSLPILDVVVKESLRLTPILHSSIRTPVRDDVIPTEDGKGIKIRKGQLINMPLEGMNTAKDIWGDDAWEYKPDRWFNLPETAKRSPGLIYNLMTFGVGPHACPGYHYAIMKTKTFLSELICAFEFAPVPEKRIAKVNLVHVRPFVAGEWDKGVQLPMLIRPYVPRSADEA
ncbi:hypothetical protein FRB90_010035 [Tulasnella sp. 427]|nr:hypothetical protein FRB90_010035 [Tulasnella sp. 427]